MKTNANGKICNETGPHKSEHPNQLQCIGSKLNRGLRIATLNVVSLRKHHCEIEQMINEHNFHILGLNETRLSKNINDPEIAIQGFEIHRKDRDINGGGVAIYIK